MREAEEPVGDPLAEERGLHVLGVGVEHVVVAAQPGEDHDVGLGDGAAGRGVLLADLQVLEEDGRFGAHGADRIACRPGPGTALTRRPFHPQSGDLCYSRRANTSPTPGSRRANLSTMEVSMENRRRFILKGATLVAAGAATQVVDAPNVDRSAQVPVADGHELDARARCAAGQCPALRQDRGRDERRPAQDPGLRRRRADAGLRRTSTRPPQGTLEMFNAAAYYWAGKEPAIQWFTAVPFGLNPQGTYDLVLLRRRPQALGGDLRRPSTWCRAPRRPPACRWPGGSGRRSTRSPTTRASRCASPGSAARSSPRPAAPWCSRRAARSTRRWSAASSTPTEWVGPHDDMKLGLHQAARYYYYPGWHEPGTTGEFAFNKKAYDALPADLRDILDYACQAMHTFVFMEYESQERHRAPEAQDRVQEQGGDPAAPARDAAGAQEAGGRRSSRRSPRRRPMAKKVYASYNKFQSSSTTGALTPKAAYHSDIAGARRGAAA